MGEERIGPHGNVSLWDGTSWNERSFQEVRIKRRLIPLRILLALNFVLTAAVVLLSAAAALKIPIALVTMPTAMILIALAAWIAHRYRRRVARSCLIFFLLATATAFFTIWPAIRNKAFVSYVSDAWLYAAFGQYLNDYPRGREAGLPPIDRYGATLSNSRFGTPTLLAFLSDLMGRTTGEVLTAWTFLMMLNVFAGIASICCIFGLSAIPALGASLFFLLCGWLHVAVFVANFDNILFLAIFPFLLVRYHLFVRGKNDPLGIVALAVSAAACFYCYPEGTAIAGAIFVPWFCGQLYLHLRNRNNWKAYIPLLAIFFLLIAPYAPTFAGYLQMQFGSTEQHPYPGENLLPGLLKSHFLPGIFAIGGEATAGKLSPVELNAWTRVIAYMLIFFLACGVIAWRKNRALIVSLIVVACFAFWQGFVHKYDYGLYKVIFMGSLLWIPCVFNGADLVSRTVSLRHSQTISLGLTGLVCVSCLAVRKANSSEFPELIYHVHAYSELKEVAKITDRKPIALVCTGDIDQQWAAFFLRDANTMAGKNTLYMSDSFPTSPADVRSESPEYVVTDYQAKGDATWRNSKFRLVRTDLPLEILAIDNPNSVEGYHQNLLWLNDHPTCFYLSSDKEQVGCLSGTALPGPSSPEKDSATVLASSEEGTQSFVVKESFSWPFRLHKGLNRIQVWCNKPATLRKLTYGDPRTMLLGLKDFSVSACEQRH